MNKILSYLIPPTIFTGISVPVAFVLILAKFPCMPPFFGSMLHTCRVGIEPGIWIRIVFLVMEFAILFPAVVASAHNICFVALPAVFCMWDYLRIIGKWWDISNCGYLANILRVIIHYKSMFASESNLKIQICNLSKFLSWRCESTQTNFQAKFCELANFVFLATLVLVTMRHSN